jgi:aspartyl-tRNA(Asn)/glutamyl-tRNA(Gln) amidotransferase subunit A
VSELHWLGVLELAAAIAARRLSPVEVVEAHLARIERHDGTLRSYLAVFADAARQEARDAEAAVLAGQPLGPLHGVPFAVKDLFAVAGTPTTAGSRVPSELARRDSTVVARLRAAGAILLGKLNLHEFAYGPEGINHYHGTPWNPWDATTPRLPGGSSSGSAVAVAAGLAPVALGTDTGGSIRIPAACCGTVGLKPTYGRVSRSGVVPLAWSLDHVGPLTRRVADAAAVLSAIAGRDSADASSAGLRVPDYVAALAGSVGRMRVGLLRQYVEQSDAEVGAALAEAARGLTGLGCTVQDVALPRAHYGLAASYAVLSAEALAYHEPQLRRHAGLYAEDVRRRLAVGAFLTATDYVNGQRARRLLRDEVDEVFGRVDCLLAPTMPVAAPPVSAAEVRSGARVESTRTAFTSCTRLFNLTGHPVIALPCGFSRDGLPLSMQLVGRAFEEGTILRLAHAYEEATDWHRRRPPPFPGHRSGETPWEEQLDGAPTRPESA